MGLCTDGQENGRAEATQLWPMSDISEGFISRQVRKAHPTPRGRSRIPPDAYQHALRSYCNGLSESYVRVKRAFRAEKPCVRQIIRHVRAKLDATFVPLCMRRHGCIVLRDR
jgi:hypothetical protein